VVKDIGKEGWYQDDYSGYIVGGKIINATPKFFIIELGGGHTKRKAKHLVWHSKDQATLNTIKKIDELIRDQFKVNILELNKMFVDMIDKYPESFV